ncbi:MAG: hypothetical protein VXY93_14225, partial [Pseudomonadota bacterium]|nr:hypothetical protein [Pseudomonadota bacterium]
MVLSRLTKITGPGVSTDTNWVGNNANFTGITTTATSFNVGVTTIHSNLAEVHNIKSTGIITATGGSFSGNVTAVDGTFSGNVSIAGTLTYEDVTNIDSIGIVTARNGIDCNGDIDVDGHTNLDNVSVAGVSTFTGLVDINGGATVNGGLTSTLLTINGGANPATINHTGGNALTLARGGKEISFNANYAASNSYASMSVTSGMDFRFTVGGRDGITIDGSNGYMGIDTQAPTAPLHIASNSAA